jgi:hypothetical protein
VKANSESYQERRDKIRDAFLLLLDHLEGSSAYPVDAVASDVLAAFDEPAVRAVWEKALARRKTDPEGAITAARTLLETICKHILEEASSDLASAHITTKTIFRSFTVKQQDCSKSRQPNIQKKRSSVFWDVALAWLRVLAR